MHLPHMLSQLVLPGKWPPTCSLVTLTPRLRAPESCSLRCMGTVMMPFQFMPATECLFFTILVVALKDARLRVLSTVNGTNDCNGLLFQS